MSIRTMSKVWECSQHSGSNLLMLLAVADFSDDDGMAFPAVEKLAKKCRMSHDTQLWWPKNSVSAASSSRLMFR